MFLMYHPKWQVPRLRKDAECAAYSLIGYPLYEYVVVKFNDRRQVLANFNSVPDKEFSLVKKYLEDL